MAADFTDDAATDERPAWFVGASWSDGDQTDRFVREGCWENDYDDKFIEDVKSVQVGDRIAIKSKYIRSKKDGLPFDNRGHNVSVMAVKAVGTVTDNPGDGRRLEVDWTPVVPHREWYFSTLFQTVHKVFPNDYKSKGLIGFAFEGQDQDIDMFRNHGQWRDKFGDQPDDQFSWTSFYSGFADKLLTFRDDRSALLAAIFELPEDRVRYLTTDQYADGTTGPVRDIDPFTAIGIFNRGTTDDNRRKVASELRRRLEIDVPDNGHFLDSFAGIPKLNNMNSWFFPRETKRYDDHIDALWRVMADAVRYADERTESNRATLIASFDDAVLRTNVSRQLTIGLYWVRPWTFVSLDRPARTYIKELGFDVPRDRPDGETYLDLCDALEEAFNEASQCVHSFPELSLAAQEADWGNEDEDYDPDDGDDSTLESGPLANDEQQSYSIDDIVADGCFLERDQIEAILKRWRDKKNLILQGPPGTGKTWLAKKLAFALIGSRSRSRVRPLQFHPNLSYEDFVRGWRPGGDGSSPLELVDGPFLIAVEDARKEPTRDFVVVIEEINRGNPAHIFGEMLTLLEADKRTTDEALALSYPRNAGERVHIPDNLYVVGTMNIADRSLALVDLALRRRFAFVDLKPNFGKRWRGWGKEQCGLGTAFLKDVRRRMTTLNQTIADDELLGEQFRVGHSVVTPNPDTSIEDPVNWFRQVVDTEIGPLLDEYWFDAPDKALSAKEELLKGLDN